MIITYCLYFTNCYRLLLLILLIGLLSIVLLLHYLKNVSKIRMHHTPKNASKKDCIKEMIHWFLIMPVNRHVKYYSQGYCFSRTRSMSLVAIPLIMNILRSDGLMPTVPPFSISLSLKWRSNGNVPRAVYMPHT